MNQIHHLTRGADLSGLCGQSLAQPGHVGLYSIDFAHATGDAACGACDLLAREARRPRHMADRRSPQALETNGLNRLADVVGLRPYPGRRAARAVAA